MDHDQLLEARIADRIRQCDDGYYLQTTGFLDLHEQSLALPLLRQTRSVCGFLYGGYADAERRMLILSPRDLASTEDEVLQMDEYVRVLRVSAGSGGRRLTHRDYLGAMLGLGIDRSLTGDILVREDGADIIIRPEIAAFLMQEYRTVGRTEIRLTEHPASELILPEQRIQVVQDTLSSLRLDNAVSAAFKISRSEAVRAIRSGIVFVDHMEQTKIDRKLEEGAVLVVRGKGKARLAEIGGESRKKRIWVRFERYM